MENDNLWAPWRMAYIRQLDPAAGNANPAAAADVAPPPAPSCFLCDALAPADPQVDRDRLVLLRDRRGVILMNLYPYAMGHLLIAPPEHVGNLSDLSAARRADLIELTSVAEELLHTAINAQGMNIGINLGRCAGAGLPGHLHVHVIPRWSGDTNFMTTVGHVRVIPESIEQGYTHLRNVLEKIKT